MKRKPTWQSKVQWLANRLDMTSHENPLLHVWIFLFLGSVWQMISFYVHCPLLWTYTTHTFLCYCTVILICAVCAEMIWRFNDSPSMRKPQNSTSSQSITQQAERDLIPTFNFLEVNTFFFNCFFIVVYHNKFVPVGCVCECTTLWSWSCRLNSTKTKCVLYHSKQLKWMLTLMYKNM